MKIDKIEIWNLRAFKHVEVSLNDYACLVGPNGAGKSTVLCALNIFFRQTEHTGTDLLSLDKEDFFKGDTQEPIKVRVTFGDLEPEASEVFQHYVRADKLIVTAEATYDEPSGEAVVRHYGERMGMEKFAPYFKRASEGALAAELNEIYAGLQEQFPDLERATSKDAKAQALRDYEAHRPEECIAIASEDAFYGVSKGANRLEQFVQWVYVPAVKDAISEQAEAKNSALGKLLARAVRAKTMFQDHLNALKEDTRAKYQTLLDDNQTALDDISSALNSRLSEWAHQGASLRLEWQEDKEKSVRIEEPWAHVKIGEGAFEGKLARLGHGLQRSYIIALLQELALYEKEGAPRLLLAIEEPELYQHPPQARHLASVLATLAQDQAQVMVSTHSPYFVSGEVFEDVRIVRRPARDESSTVKWATAQDVAARIAELTGEPFVPATATIARLQQILQPQLAEMFFASSIVLVEGREDLAYIKSYLELSGAWDEFRKLGCHFVAVDGKSELLRPLVVAQLTEVPCFVVFDADGDETNEQRRAMHERDNSRLLMALGETGDNAFPNDPQVRDGYAVWPSCLSKTVRESVDPAIWQQCQNAADLAFGQAGDLQKNVMHIATKIERLWEAGVRPEPLEKLQSQLLNFAGLRASSEEPAPIATGGICA